jgi:excisionase family DNA binding protein
MVEAIGEGWATTGEAAALTGYSDAYVRWLASQGRIQAHKVGRDWLVNLQDVVSHKEQMDALGDQRHNPWRDGLAEQERGRRKGGNG